LRRDSNVDSNNSRLADARGSVSRPSREEAATVNIPPKGTGTTNVPGADVPEVPVPLRPLEPNEELYFDWGSILMVKNTDLFEQSETGFTQEDRALLKQIAAKLGIL
jgi:hypothetical protein